MNFWNLLGIGHVTQVDDSQEIQRIQVTEKAQGTGFADRVTDKVRRIMEFGFTSVPPLETEVLVLRRDGDRSQAMVVGTSHRPSRIKNLEAGDTVLYDVRGSIVKLIQAGVLIESAGKVTIQDSRGSVIRLDAAGITIDSANNVAISDSRGAFVKLTSDGIVVDGAGLAMTIQNIDTLTVDGDLHVTGEVEGHSGGSPISLTTHTHSGVTAGAAASGPPVP
jgi:phage baseplate assembly protein V